MYINKKKFLHRLPLRGLPKPKGLWSLPQGRLCLTSFYLTEVNKRIELKTNESERTEIKQIKIKGLK